MIKAIETVYNGYRFRSRLEARWAVFFDTLGVTYEYEKEGYDLEGLWYLPDFWLPTAGAWVEIKPPDVAVADVVKLAKLARLSGRDAMLFSGQPWPGEYTIRYYFGDYNATVLSPGFDGHFVETPDGPYMHLTVHLPFNGNLQAAYEAARSARFEHGETPR